MQNSSFKYPLSNKYNIVSKLSENLHDNTFSIYTDNEWLMDAGGFDGLFLLKDKKSFMSFDYPNYNNFVQSFSLSLLINDPVPLNIVLVTNENNSEKNFVYQYKSGNLTGYIIPN